MLSTVFDGCPSRCSLSSPPIRPSGILKIPRGSICQKPQEVIMFARWRNIKAGIMGRGK